MDISNILLKERGKRNYSQQQVAELLDISQSTYCDWESGNSHPKMGNLLKIVQLFELDLNELFNPTGVNIVNSPNTISNNPHSKVETPEALIRIAENLEKLIFVIEKIMANIEFSKHKEPYEKLLQSKDKQIFLLKKMLKSK